MSVGKLFVLEGTDGSGKATQTRLLLERLAEQGVAAEVFEFPQYEDSVYGTLTGKLLKGEFGDFVGMSPYLSSLSYALDRATARDRLLEALETKMVICNRYTPSNIAYQSAKLPTAAEQDEFIGFTEKGEYEELGLPRPAGVLFLDVPLAVSQKLVSEKKKRSYLDAEGEADQHEKDGAYQERVRQVYHRLAKERNDWHVVECALHTGIMPRETICDEVWKLIEPRLS